MKVLFYRIIFLTLSFLYGCSAVEEPCINVDTISDKKLGTMIGKELNKIYYEADHFHRRTGDPSDYEILELDTQDENIKENESD